MAPLYETLTHYRTEDPHDLLRLPSTDFFPVSGAQKADSRSHHAFVTFGLTPSERVHTDQTNGQRVFPATVFDIGEEKGNKIIIHQSPPGLTVAIDSGEEQLISCPEQLIRTGTKVFREADNFCLRELLGSFMSSDDDENVKSEDKTVERSEDLKSFEYCTFEGEEKSKVFLNGALKITRTTFKGAFNFYGRIEQNDTEQKNFDRVVNFLKHEESMVISFE